MFTIEENTYDFKYNIGAIKKIESALGKSLLVVLANSDGQLKIDDLELCAAFGIVDESGAHIPIKEARKVAGEAIEKSYVDTAVKVFEAIQRDCPFLFRTNVLSI